MVHLFSSLPSEIQGAKNQHTPDKAFDCEKLAAEWERIVIQTQTLRKVFVSIKGIYYQAKVQGQDITWLVPHQFNQVVGNKSKEAHRREKGRIQQFICSSE
jgi:pescadillo protein